MDLSSLKGTVFDLPQIRTLSAAVVGAGALGNEVIKALGLLGVGRILVVDPDVVEPGNLNRSVLLRHNDFTNRNKAEAIKEAADLLFPDTEFRAVPKEIADTSTALLTEAEIIFSCVDSDLARLEIAYLATKFDLPVSEGGLGGHQASQGRATWFPGRKGACYSCKLPAQRRRELLTLWQANSHSCRIPPDNTNVPSTPTMAAIIGSMQVELGIKNLLAGKTHSESVELSFEGVPRLERIRNMQASECPFHVEPSEVRVRAKKDETARGLLLTTSAVESPDAYIRLDWPICIAVRCISCSYQWAPMLRAGYLHRYAVCPQCGASEIKVLDSIQNLTAGDPSAASPLSRFGIAPGDWISVRVG